MPSSALAIASRRRATRASVSALASLRSTTAVRSLRIDSAVILPSSNQSGGNHTPNPLGIAPKQQESSLSTAGIILVYPATVGSSERPSPTGEFKVSTIAHNPTYHYDPSLN